MSSQRIEEDFNPPPRPSVWPSPHPTIQHSTRDWMPQAACRGLDPNLFIGDRGAPCREPRRVCSACPVQQECLDYAMWLDAQVDVGVLGTWGGKTVDQRKKMRAYSKRELAKLYR